VGRFKIRFAAASYWAKVSKSFLRVFVASASFAWVGVLFGSLELWLAGRAWSEDWHEGV